MNLIATQYTLQYHAFEIYVSGCKANPHCTGCHNPQSWSFDIGEFIDTKVYEKITDEIEDFSKLIDNIWLLGGEPLDQNILEFTTFCIDLKRDTEKKLWLFTRYELPEVKDKLKEYIKLFDYIKCGKYISELSAKDYVQQGVQLATTNQKIYQLEKDY